MTGNGGRARSCPSCGAENIQSSPVCRSCGAPLPAVHDTLAYPPAPSEAAKAGQAATPPYFAAGAAFGRRYRIIEEVGRGGMGRVYKAEDTELGTTVALKMIRPELAADPEVIERFKTEVRLARSISHDNVVRIHDLGEVGRVKYVSMDFIKGEDLKSLIRLSGPLSVDMAVKVALQAGEALRAAHRKNIVHQDLKPQNIMIDADGRVYVTDFGLATLRTAAGAAGPALTLGTPLYASPEQARGAPADLRSDIYSFGVVLYEMLTGRELFQGETPIELARRHQTEAPVPPARINPSVPPSLEKIVLKCLAKDPNARFQSFDDLLAELRRLKPEARYASRPTTGRRLLRGVLVLLMLLGAAAGILLLGPKTKRPAATDPASQRRSFTVAVLEAVNHTGDPALDYLSGAIQELLCTDLVASLYLDVLSTDRIHSVLDSMDRPGVPYPSREILERIAEDEGVDYFILPGFMRAGDRFRVDIKVRRAGAREITDTAQADGNNVFDLIDALTPRLKSILRLSQAEIAADEDRNLAEITTDSPEALRYYMEGKSLYLEEKFAESNRALAKAVDIDPQFALAYKKMAENSHYLDDIPGSRAQIQKALALLDHVSMREGYLIEGFAAALLDDAPDKALASYRSLVERRPKDVEGHMLLGSVYRNLERWSDAERAFATVRDLNPRSELAVENLAFVYCGMGEPDRALSLVEASLPLFPDSGILSWRRTLLFMILRRFDDALRVLERPLAADPSNSYGLELSGNILQLKDDLKGARSFYKRVGAGPDAPVPIQQRCWTALAAIQAGRFREASTELGLAVASAEQGGHTPDAARTRLALAQIKLSRGQWDEAGAAAREAAALAKQVRFLNEQKIALMISGLAAAGAGRPADAEAFAASLRELIARTGVPAHERYYAALRAALEKAGGDLPQAIEWQERAVALLPGQIDQVDEHAFFLYGLGQLCEAAGAADRALAAYERLAALTTGRLRWGDLFALAHYRLGALREAGGDRERAALSYERFLSFWNDADPGLPEPARARARLKALKTP